MIRYTENGTVFTYWSVDRDDDLLGIALVVRTMVVDFGEAFLWLDRVDDVQRLDDDAVNPAPTIIAVGPNGSDHEYDRALKAFCRRHGVRRVYRIMAVGSPRE